jgi:hypothetical protein
VRSVRTDDIIPNNVAMAMYTRCVINGLFASGRVEDQVFHVVHSPAMLARDEGVRFACQQQNLWSRVQLPCQRREGHTRTISFFPIK